MQHESVNLAYYRAGPDLFFRWADERLHAVPDS